MSITSRLIKTIFADASGNLTAKNTPAADDNSKKVVTTEWVRSLFEGSGKQLLSGNGYQQLPGGAIVQWGTTSSIASNTSQTVTFPIPFPNACLAVVGSPVSSLASTSSTVNSIGPTSFSARNNSGSSNPVCWIAIGY